MGNQPSSEAYYREPHHHPPPPSDRPLPPIPVSDDWSPHTSSSTQRLSKPQTQTRSTAGLLKSSDGLAKGTSPGRFLTSGIAQLVASSFSSPSTPTSSSFAAHNSSRPLPSLPSSLSPTSPGPPSPSVFTFEEAVAAVTGQRDPAAWRPVSSIYPTPNLDLELLQEQQARQLEFQLRQRQNQLQHQKVLLEAQYQQRESQSQRYTSYDSQSGIQGQAGTGVVGGEPAERGSRNLQRPELKQKQRRRSFFRSRSSQRTVGARNDQDDYDADYQRRNSIGSVYSHAADRHTWDFGSMTYNQSTSQYYGGTLSENWPPPAGSRTSWNYDMTSYAAKRLLHIVDDNDPIDYRYEQASVTSESRYSMLSEVTWKSSHPVRPESPTLTRANSDLSLYAPVRRTSMIQVPGVATRRNSTSSSVGVGAMSTRPAFRHSHSATTPSLSRQISDESLATRVLSMPVLQRPDISVFSADQSAARVSTPTDSEYNAIGAFKLGSLRITNGSASPMASPERKRTRNAESDRDDRARSPGFDLRARSMALAALSANASTEIKDDMGSVGLEHEEVDGHSSTNKNSHANLNQLSASLFGPSDSLPKAQEQTEIITYRASPEPVSSPTELPQIELSDDLFADFEFSTFTFEEGAPTKVLSEESSWESAPATPMLQTTSKATAMEDHLFDDDQSTLDYSSTEILDVRVDPNAKASIKRSRARLLATRKSAHSVQSVNRSDSGFVPSPTSETSHKPLSKADSGYSSNVSLRSFKQAASKLMAPVAKAANRLSSDRSSSIRAPDRESFFIDELKLPSPTIDAPEMAFRATDISTAEQRPPPPAREAPPPPPQARTVPSPRNLSKDMLPLSPISILLTDTSTPVPSESSVPGLLGGSTPREKRRLTAPMLLDTTQPGFGSDSHASPKSSPNPLTPVSLRSNDSASVLSSGSGTQRPNRLLRLLSFANGTTSTPYTHMGPHTVHVTHTDDENIATIPSVAKDDGDGPRERTGLFPMMTKRLAPKTQMSRDTLKTIFSVGSLDSRSNTDLHATTNVKAVSKRKSGLAMTVDFSNSTAGKENSPDTVPPSEEGQIKRGRLSWRRRTDQQPPRPESGNGTYDGAALGTILSSDGELGGSFDDDTAVVNNGRRTHSRSSSIISRTMSLTAQLERSLSLKLAFPRHSKPRGPDGKGGRAPLVSAFSTALDARPLDLDLPSPLFAGAMARQMESMTPEHAAKAPLPVSARMQQMRPSMLRVPPQLRPQSTGPSESGSRCVSRQSSRDSLYGMASARSYSTTGRHSIDHGDVDFIASALVASPPLLTSPMRQTQPKWEVKTDHASGGLPSRRRDSFDRQSRGSTDGGRGRDKPKSSVHARSNSMVSSRGHDKLYAPQRSLSGDGTYIAGITSGGGGIIGEQGYEGNQGNLPRPRVLRYRASYDGYSNGSLQEWTGAAFELPQNNAPSMSNGYTAPSNGPPGGAHRKSGSVSSGRGDIYQLQQQQAWEYYYQQYARPPPSLPRSHHSRNRSMGSRYGPVSGPRAPYRILHSYNSPAYRGVPIWG